MNDKNTENINQSILHFIQGNANDNEHAEVLNWISENPENRKELFKQKDLWNAAEIDSDRLKELENSEWDELQNRIDTSKVKLGFFKELVKIAAIIIVALGVGWMSHYFYTEAASVRKVEMRTVEAIKGQIKEVFLADGTHVWLNSGSRLSFPSNFTEKNREISLQGEAYFEVTSSEKNPFLVKTGNHTVKVTGTKFNICEYPGNKIIETTLVEGKVKIISGNIFKDLYPGEQSTFYTETAEVLIGEKDFDIYTAWREGRYEFRNESVDKVFQIMERWWDVKIEYSKEQFKYEYISGVLRKHKPIKQHFDVINELVPIDYQIDNDNITVKLK
ncbi:FecR family protein [Draconibacterium orientale]|uniref:FecR family protein n=1 Tax=Draconibacterium orientale TaxID=1168034 RepID=UPI002A0A3A48|nr:FecR family protein [Draconibacterium orientale]